MMIALTEGALYLLVTVVSRQRYELEAIKNLREAVKNLCEAIKNLSD
jgi:hypothetical protein